MSGELIAALFREIQQLSGVPLSEVPQTEVALWLAPPTEDAKEGPTLTVWRVGGPVPLPNSEHIVLALFADSTNIDRPGFTGSETEIIPAFEEIFSSATGRLIVSAFSSSIYRLQIVVDLAAQFVNMIQTQRGFQANSRSVTTTDTMMEEVVNLKR